jgi:hypothetical protein
VSSTIQTVADPINAGEGLTFGRLTRPASEHDMGRKRIDVGRLVRVDISINPKVGGTVTMTDGALISSSIVEIGDALSMHQPLREFTLRNGQNPYGVESNPKSAKNFCRNLGTLLPLPAWMTETTGDRGNRGRSLRSSPRAGKPSTWRREAVGTVSKQGVDHV